MNNKNNIEICNFKVKCQYCSYINNAQTILISKFNKKILKSIFCYWCREQQNFYFKFIDNIPTVLEFVDELSKQKQFNNSNITIKFK